MGIYPFVSQTFLNTPLQSIRRSEMLPSLPRVPFPAPQLGGSHLHFLTPEGPAVRGTCPPPLRGYGCAAHLPPRTQTAAEGETEAAQAPRPGKGAAPGGMRAPQLCCREGGTLHQRKVLDATGLRRAGNIPPPSAWQPRPAGRAQGGRGGPLAAALGYPPAPS